MNVETRLSELRDEFKRGQHHLEVLEQKRQEIRDTLLRISGAIQILEEVSNLERTTASNEANGENEARSRLEAVAV